MNTRQFRTPESYDSERVTRNMLVDYLRDRGFQDMRDDRSHHGKTESQIIHATTSDGERIAMRVRLCWRRATGKEAYSAMQVLAKVKNDDWEGTLHEKVERERSHGVTHFLIVQRDNERILYAALVPLSELTAIWCAQRDISKSLIAQQKLGRKKANPAMNGLSPTLWLQFDQAPEVVEALWKHPDVQNIANWEITTPIRVRSHGADYMSDVDYSLFGSDGVPSKHGMRSYAERDQRVRKVVLGRAQGKCENCGTARGYIGFLDVHHIFGAQNSDRVWHCVALCPNCHREAHAAPDRDEINARLLYVAKRFQKSAESDADRCSGGSTTSLLSRTNHGEGSQAA